MDLDNYLETNKVNIIYDRSDGFYSKSNKILTDGSITNNKDINRIGGIDLVEVKGSSWTVTDNGQQKILFTKLKKYINH